MEGARVIAIVGDRSEAVTAHRAIPAALSLVSEELGGGIAWQWVPTASIGVADDTLRGFSGVWLAPGSPYENTQGALDAVRWAREGNVPFLGTCGGFQHALIELARNVAGIAGADHAETNPGGRELVVTRLSCSLVEVSAAIHFADGSLLRTAYGSAAAEEGYRCNYGPNPGFEARLEAAGLRFTARDDAGNIRGAELASHPFFAGVLFQPERAALRGRVPPLAKAFGAAVAGFRGSGPGLRFPAG